jgi:hypothetical protein
MRWSLLFYITNIYVKWNEIYILYKSCRTSSWHKKWLIYGLWLGFFLFFWLLWLGLKSPWLLLHQNKKSITFHQDCKKKKKTLRQYILILIRRKMLTRRFFFFFELLFFYLIIWDQLDFTKEIYEFSGKNEISFHLVTGNKDIFHIFSLNFFHYDYFCVNRSN